MLNSNEIFDGQRNRVIKVFNTLKKMGHSQAEVVECAQKACLALYEELEMVEKEKEDIEKENEERKK